MEEDTNIEDMKCQDNQEKLEYKTGISSVLGKRTYEFIMGNSSMKPNPKIKY